MSPVFAKQEDLREATFSEEKDFPPQTPPFKKTSIILCWLRDRVLAGNGGDTKQLRL